MPASGKGLIRPLLSSKRVYCESTRRHEVLTLSFSLLRAHALSLSRARGRDLSVAPSLACHMTAPDHSNATHISAHMTAPDHSNATIIKPPFKLTLVMIAASLLTCRSFFFQSVRQGDRNSAVLVATHLTDHSFKFAQENLQDCCVNPLLVLKGRMIRGQTNHVTREQRRQQPAQNAAILLIPARCVLSTHLANRCQIPTFSSSLCHSAGSMLFLHF